MLCVKFVKQKKSNIVFGVHARTTFLQIFNMSLRRDGQTNHDGIPKI